MRLHRYALFGSICVAAILGCVANSEHPQSTAAPNEGEKKTDKPAEVKRVELKKNILLEIEGDKRRVLVKSEVCLREGLLEQLLTRKPGKDHESVLWAEIDARDLHFALTVAKAEPGKVVQFRPKLAAPTGTTVKITLEYEAKGKTVRVPAQQWIRNIKTKKDLPTDWVFAGSVLIPDPQNPKAQPFYGANQGDVITIVNFETSMLDVPFLNTKDNDDLVYEAHTERIPALKTPVLIILEPVLEKKK